ncbi:Carotenoid oxygenase - like 10, partial [Theobroma cacao]
MEPTNCQVIEGELPLSLNGVYIRNGPNPQLQARRALHFLIHDFATTKSFEIFHETQLIFSLAKVLTGRGGPLVYDPNKRTKLGSYHGMLNWFEVPGFNAAHIINAWENGTEEIVFVASNVRSVKDFLFNRKLDVVLEKVKINIETGNVCRNILSTRNLELGSINTAYVGKKSRYAYLG